LLSSGATVTWAHHAVIVRAKKQSIIALILTIILAIIFTLLQGIEYLEAPFTITDSVFGSCFYMATGFHGFHVFIGTCSLFVSLLRIILNHFTATHHFGFESAAWYWHFVDGAGVKHVTYRFFIYFAQRASVIFRLHAWKHPASSFPALQPKLFYQRKRLF
jgi:heme/copper-type cytochrome/quinol oxidase subunit 3